MKTPPLGLEPRTSSLGGTHPIQLGHGGMIEIC